MLIAKKADGILINEYTYLWNKDHKTNALPQRLHSSSNDSSFLTAVWMACMQTALWVRPLIIVFFYINVIILNQYSFNLRLMFQNPKLLCLHCKNTRCRAVELK